MVGWGGWYEGKKSGVIGPKKKMMMMDVTHLLTMPHAAGKKGVHTDVAPNIRSKYLNCHF